MVLVYMSASGKRESIYSYCVYINYFEERKGAIPTWCTIFN